MLFRRKLTIMTPILSTTLISFNLIIFLSFLSIRIDQTIKWNWFLVFIPVFFLKACFIADSIALIIRNRKSTRLRIFFLLFYLICVFLMLAFEILLCLKLEYFPYLNCTYMFIPLWSLFIIFIVYILFKVKRD